MPFGLETLPPEMMGLAITTIASMGAAVVCFIFLALILFMTKGVTMPFLKAKMRGRSVLLNFKKDKKMVVETVKNEAGMYKSKIGQHMINPESIYLSPNNVPISIGYEAVGSVLNPKHIKFIQKLLKEGVPVKDGKGKVKMRKIENITELKEVSDTYKKKTGDDLVLTYDGETLRVQDIVNFFLYDNNPSLMEAKIENKLAKEREGERKIPFKMFMVMIPLIMTLIIGYMILSGYMAGQSYQTEWKKCVEDIAKYQTSQRVVTATTIPAPTEIS